MQADVPKGVGTTSFSQHRGQSIAALLGATAYCMCPVMLDLTDGQIHHLLQIHDMELYVWKNLTPTQAYYKQAEHLKTTAQTVGPTKLRKMALSDIPEEQQLSIKKLRALQPSNGLLEQLDSVVPHLPQDQQLSCAIELISSWQASSPEMSLEASRMFN